jgi:hypothetical protein
MVNISAGDYLPGAHLTSEVKLNNDSTTAIGDVCTVQSSAWHTAGTTTNNKGPFRVAISGSNYTTAGASTIQTADTTFTALVDGYVYLKADGVVGVGSLVMCSASTAGRIQAYTSTVVATTPLQADVQASRDEYRLVVGVYEGHANEGSVGSPPTAGADGDILRIRFRGQV